MKKTVVLVTMVFLLVVLLAGCNWFEHGLLNVINPRSQIRMYYSFQAPGEVAGMDLLTRRTLNLVVYPLNEVGFTVEELQFHYRTMGVEVPELSRTMHLAYYVPPSPYTPGGVFTPGTGTAPYAITNLALLSQQGIDYLWLNPHPGDLTLTLKAIIRDDAGNIFDHTVIDGFLILEMGEDFVPPTVIIQGPTAGTAGQTLTFLATATDNYMVKTIRWYVRGGGGGNCPVGGGGCPGGTTTGSGSGNIFSFTFTQAGTYTVVAEACDYAGNCGYAAVTVEIAEEETTELTPIQ